MMKKSNHEVGTGIWIGLLPIILGMLPVLILILIMLAIVFIFILMSIYYYVAEHAATAMESLPATTELTSWVSDFPFFPFLGTIAFVVIPILELTIFRPRRR